LKSTDALGPGGPWFGYITGTGLLLPHSWYFTLMVPWRCCSSCTASFAGHHIFHMQRL